MALKLYIEPYGENVWIDRFVKLIAHTLTTIEDCDYIVSTKTKYGNSDNIHEVVNSYMGVNKKVIVFMLSDFNDPINIPNNVFLFRSGMYKSQKKSNEFLIPHIWTSDGIDNNRFPPLGKVTHHPIVGFCGCINTHPCRFTHINKLNMSPDIKKKFILRSQYWAGKPHDSQVINEFTNNIKESHFTLCSRGNGNWSARFYQVLHLGRIPIVVNTDLVLPFEDRINWRDIIVFCDSENDINNNIRSFWRNKNIVEAQNKCRETYEAYLAPERWCKIITDEILIPNK
jgi:hypothetical protein